MLSPLNASQQGIMDALPGRAAASEGKFTKDVIRAIEDLELRRITRSAQELADTAWEKLQYDLPVVEPLELAALVDRLRCSLHGKSSWPCYVLTQKAIENIIGGARRSKSFAPGVSQPQQQLQQQLADSINASVRRKTDHSSKHSGRKAAIPVHSQGHAGIHQQPAGHSLQDLYQQLCAVVLVQYVAKVVSLSEQDAWQLLQNYNPEQELDSEQQQQQSDHGACEKQLQEQLMDQQLSAGLLQTALAGVLGGSHTVSAQNTMSDQVYASVEAAVQDDDGDDYEACDTPNTAQQSSKSIKPSTWHQHQQHQPYSWLELRHRLLSLANEVQYQLMCHDALWQQHAAAEHVLQVLRALGAHSHTAELQPMVHTYAGLLVDRIAAAPADIILLQQLWEALGLSGQGCASSGTGTTARGGGKEQSHHSNMHVQGQALPAEAVLGLTAAASVWQQVPGTGSRSKLWRLMFENLLPLLEQCTEQLAYCSSSDHVRVVKAEENANDITETTAALQQQQVKGETLAHVLLVSHIIELLILGQPSGADTAGQLTQLGLTRNLVQLFVHHSGLTAVEPLSRALLLCCYSSQHTADWVLAVPAVRQQLQQSIFQSKGSAEAHGALWEVVMSKARPTVPAASQTTAANSSTGCQLMLSLLQLLPDSVQQLQRQVVLLQLMCDVQQAAVRQRLWEATVVAAVKQLAARVKQSQAAAAKAHRVTMGGVQAANAMTMQDAVGRGKGTGTEFSAEGTDMQDSSKGLTKTSSADVAPGGNHEQQHLQQLWVLALKCTKQLLTQGGKTD